MFNLFQVSRALGEVYEIMSHRESFMTHHFLIACRAIWHKCWLLSFLMEISSLIQRGWIQSILSNYFHRGSNLEALVLRILVCVLSADILIIRLGNYSASIEPKDGGSKKPVLFTIHYTIPITFEQHSVAVKYKLPPLIPFLPNSCEGTVIRNIWEISDALLSIFLFKSIHLRWLNAATSSHAIQNGVATHMHPQKSTTICIAKIVQL